MALVSFNQVVYMIPEEGDIVSVCMTVAGNVLHRSISISLSTVGNTAEGL